MADDAATKVAKRAIRQGMVLSSPATNKAVELVVRALRASGMLIDSGGERAEAEDQDSGEDGGDED
jgi:hypothetical protein